MNEILGLLSVLLAGVALGWIFYGGLWLTVSRAIHFQNPALWFLGSMLLRTGITLAGVYILFDGRWERLVACLVGFAIGRMVVTFMVGPIGDGRSDSREGAAHAP